jgi:hypothetical protein
VVLQRQRRFDDALHAYDEALRVNPGMVEAKTNRAWLLKHRRQRSSP